MPRCGAGIACPGADNRVIAGPAVAEDSQVLCPGVVGSRGCSDPARQAPWPAGTDKYQRASVFQEWDASLHLAF